MLSSSTGDRTKQKELNLAIAIGNGPNGESVLVYDRHDKAEFNRQFQAFQLAELKSEGGESYNIKDHECYDYFLELLTGIKESL